MTRNDLRAVYTAIERAQAGDLRAAAVLIGAAPNERQADQLRGALSEASISTRRTAT